MSHQILITRADKSQLLEHLNLPDHGACRNVGVLGEGGMRRPRSAAVVVGVVGQSDQYELGYRVL
jgi:hypothetical protein